jgi:putative ABC transport system substrate-binding protein
MRRREFITLLGGATVAWPLAGHSQQPAMPVVGILGSTPPDDAATASFLASFNEGLRDVGYVRNKRIPAMSF